MGVGTPVNILENISLGIDMFDCVMPTRNARNGMLFTQNGIINIRNKKWERDFSAIDADLMPEYSKAYLRHLFIAEEMLAKGGLTDKEYKIAQAKLQRARLPLLRDERTALTRNELIRILSRG